MAIDTNRSIVVGGFDPFAGIGQVRRVLSVDYEGQTADFYVALLTRDGSTCPGVGDCLKFPYQEKITSWVSTDGRPLKWVSETNRGAPNVLSRKTITYEMDSKDLKIEAPIK